MDIWSKIKRQKPGACKSPAGGVSVDAASLQPTPVRVDRASLASSRQDKARSLNSYLYASTQNSELDCSAFRERSIRVILVVCDW